MCMQPVLPMLMHILLLTNELADVTVEEVVSVMKNDKGTGKKDIEKAK